MAAAGQAFRLCLRNCRQISAFPRIPPPRRSLLQRAFTTSTIRWADNRKFNNADQGDDEEIPNPYENFEDVMKDLTPEQLKVLEDMVKDDHGSEQPMPLSQFFDEQEQELSKERAWDLNPRSLLPRTRANRNSFWYDEDDPDTVTEEVGDEFDEDDITSMAHGKLDEIREYRHYARVAAWEMPLLSKLAKPFEPPSDDQVLRFRYTSYMGEFHPSEKKVVVQFSPADLKLTPVQTEKLKKLAGPRYNPEKDIIKISSESFEHQAQNKRYISDLVDKLIATAKDPTDTFEDIPLDTRHHNFTRKPKFPVEWRMTDERKQQLAAIRQEAEQIDAGKAAQGLLVDGLGKIDAFLEALAAADETKTPETVAVGGRGKQKARR